MLKEELQGKHLEAITGMSCIYGESPKVDPNDEKEAATAVNKMTIPQIKHRMLAYRDFHGGDLISSSSIKSARTKNELAKLLDEHHDFLEMQLADALSHLEHFRKELNISTY